MSALKDDLGHLGGRFPGSDSTECIKKLIEVFRAGRLTEEFNRDPFGTLACVATVIAAILGRFGENGIAFGGSGVDADLTDLYRAIDPNLATRDVGDTGFFEIIIIKLIDELKAVLLEWLSRR